MANRPVSSQTSSKVDMSQSVDAQAPLLRVYTFGAFHLDWQVPPFTIEDLWKSRTSARTLLKLLLCAPGRQASRSQLAGILWPEIDEDKARESLRSASKVLRKVLCTARARMVRHLADLYLQRGQVNLAEEVLEQQIIRFPTDQDALYRLLLLLEQQGCVEEVKELERRLETTSIRIAT